MIIDNRIHKIAKQVIKECKSIPLDTTKYRLNIYVQLVDEAISATIQNLLASLSTVNSKIHHQHYWLAT